MAIIQSKIAVRLALFVGLAGIMAVLLQTALLTYFFAPPLHQIIVQLLFGILNTLLLSLIILLATRTLVVNPLAQLNQLTKRLSTGEWRANVKCDRPDELGQLINAFNKMGEELQRLFVTLEKRIVSRTRDLQIAANVSRQITTVLEIDHLLQQVVTLTVQEFNLYATSVFLIEENKGLLINAASADRNGQIIPDEGWVTIPLAARPSIIARTTRTREPVIVNDVAQSPDYLGINSLPQTRSEMAIPIILGNRLLGIFDLQSDKLNLFDQEDLRVFKTLADQIAVAIENARLYAAVQQELVERKRAEEEVRKFNETLEQRVADRTRELSALYEVTSVASESLDLETTLQRSLERVLTVVNGKAGAIHLLDKTRKALELAFQHGLPPDSVAHIELMTLNGDPLSRVLDQGNLLITANPADLRQIFPSSYKDLNSYVGLPMRARNQPIGVLSVVSSAEQSNLNLEEIALLTAIADQVGVVVDSARLRQRAEQAAVMEERERLARELHDSVTQSLYSLTLLAEWASDLVETEQMQEAKHRLCEIGEIAQQALKEMRLLLYQLRPAALEQDGLVRALQQRLDAVERRAGVEIELQTDSSIILPPLVEEGLYRITLEALNNTLKHAAAHSVLIRLHANGNNVSLCVQDDGQGFLLDTADAHGGLGLISMRERAKQIGATLDILSKPGQGTTVNVTLSDFSRN